ncbi:MAG: winged helix-turn-helix transcriptional regulator [Proteobacteria bacterium]|nr:winged helix-turn-helix transcriptional regulator [Pseudomonadota bacterium]
MPDKIPTDVCQEECVHEELVSEVKEKMPPSETLLDLANLFKVLGDHTRVRILNALRSSELCVCDLVDVLDMSQSAVSHQLRVLRASKIVKYRKEGKNVYYSLDDDHVYTLIDDGLDHIKEER